MSASLFAGEEHADGLGSDLISDQTYKVLSHSKTSKAAHSISPKYFPSSPWIADIDWFFPRSASSFSDCKLKLQLHSTTITRSSNYNFEMSHFGAEATLSPSLPFHILCSYFPIAPFYEPSIWRNRNAPTIDFIWKKTIKEHRKIKYAQISIHVLPGFFWTSTVKVNF